MRLEIPPDVPVLEGFRVLSDAETESFVRRYGLAMDADDLRCCGIIFRLGP